MKDFKRSLLSPEQDGISHINVYSKARTPLGLFLSNFTKIELETEEGDFCSIEAYWYYLSSDGSHPRVEELKDLFGYEAKRLGREIRGQDYNADNDPEFQGKIKQALRFKIENSQFRLQFAKSTLPFEHYYVHDGKVVEPKDGRWQIDFLEELRKEFRSGLSILDKG